MRNAYFIEGVNIIAKYIPKEEINDFGIQSEHDQIWFGSFDWVIDEKDKERLIELCWFEDEDAWSCHT